jgi:putative hydrolase of the HAD superfamily
LNPPVRAVVFDMGGVLVELTGEPVFAAWCGGRFTTDEIWRRWLASPAVRAFERGHVEPEAFADRLIAEFELPVGREALLRTFDGWLQGPLPGALDLVRRVDPRLMRAMLSNSNVIHWERMLDMGFRDEFTHHFGSHLIGKLKPDEDVFEHVVRTLGCAAAEVVFLDDQPLNVAAARQVGLQAVLARGVKEAEAVLEGMGMLQPVAGGGPPQTARAVLAVHTARARRARGSCSTLMRGVLMAKRDDETKRTGAGTTATSAPVSKVADALEQRLMAFAEQLGKIAGAVETKAKGWMESDALNIQIAKVRDSAAELLEQLAQATKATKPEARKARSGGVVDAPGKKHRGPAPADPHATAPGEQAAKLRAARPMAKTTRLRGRG